MRDDPDRDITTSVIASIMLLLTSVLGAVFVFIGPLPLIGRLPLDLVIALPGRILEIPIGTCLVISLVLAGIAHLVSSILHK